MILYPTYIRTVKADAVGGVEYGEQTWGRGVMSHMVAPRGLSKYVDTIQCANAATFLRELPPDSVDMVVTSPPYFQQREYAGGAAGGERRLANYIDAISEVFHECVRVTKESGNIVFNMGDKYLHGCLMLVPYRFALHALESENVTLVNNITWLKTNPTPRQYRRRLVSSTEPFFHFVKSDRYYYDLDSFQERGARQAPKTTTLGSRYVRLIQESDLTEDEKRGALVALDAAVDDVIRGRITGFRMKIRGIHSLPFGGAAGGRMYQLKRQGFTIIRMTGRTLKRDAIESKVEGLKWNDHPAIYPLDLVSDMVRLLSPPGSIVLDPYIGSGTTGVAAKMLGRHYLGIDINPKFCVDASERIRAIGTS